MLVENKRTRKRPDFPFRAKNARNNGSSGIRVPGPTAEVRVPLLCSQASGKTGLSQRSDRLGNRTVSLRWIRAPCCWRGGLLFWTSRVKSKPHAVRKEIRMALSMVLILGLLGLAVIGALAVGGIVVASSRKSGHGLVPCPGCGGKIPQFTENCPHCGRELLPPANP